MIGDNIERDIMFDYCEKNGFRIVRSGGKMLKFPKISDTKFEIIAEREIGDYKVDSQ